MYNPGSGVRLRSSARTSTGQVRENNEDNVHLFARDQFVLAIVADGMGGAAAGEEASRIAVDTIHGDLATSDYNDKYRSMEEDTITEMLRDAIRSANDNIVQKAINSPSLKGMGTTVTLALVRDSAVVIAHVGDSRAYYVDSEARQIRQITSDHSFVEALVAAGHITREEAEDHPMKNVLYRALGQAEDIDIDIYHNRLHVGDRLVLCSDGLTRHVKSAEIMETVLAESDPAISSQQLIDLANQRGGEDNISVVVITVERDPTRSSQEMAKVTENEDDTILLKDRAVLLRSQPLEMPPVDEEDTSKARPVSGARSEDDTPTVTHRTVPLDGSESAKGSTSEGRDSRTPDQ